MSCAQPRSSFDAVLGGGRARRACSRRTGSRSARRSLAALVNVVFGLLVAWVLVRYQFPGKRVRRRAGRPAVRAADGRRGHRADGALSPSNGWIGAVPRAARDQGRVHAARRRRRADRSSGCRSSCARCSRCSRICDARSRRPRRRLGASRWQTFVRVIFPAVLPGVAHRLRARVRARARRVRLGRLHLRQHADEDRDRARC